VKAKLRPLAVARVQDPERWSKAVAQEVRGHMAELGAIGWTLWDIAAAVGCSRTSLVSWRSGAAEMPASKLLLLREVVALNASGRKAAG
jgi:hypothetical protein